MSLKEDFKKFAMRGNVIDMAVGVIIGGAFGKIVGSLVNDIIMPPIGMAMGKIDFKNLFISLNGKEYATLEAAKKGRCTCACLWQLYQYCDGLFDFGLRYFYDGKANQ